MSTLGNNMMEIFWKQNSMSAKSYIQDGLIGLFDGIENIGWGKHDPNSSVWVDLSGNIADLSVPSGMLWADDSLKFDGILKHYINTQTDFGELQDYTFEIVFNRDLFTNYASCFSQVENGGTGWQCYEGKEYPCIGNPGGGYYPKTATDTLLGNHYKAMTADTASKKCHQYINGSNKVCFESSYTGTRYNTTKFNFVIGIDAGDVKKKTLIGGISRIGVYNRALIDEEIAHNYAIDKARFNLP